MQWTMPRRALQIVAALIGAAAIASFAMGILNAPQRGRLPGEKPDGASGPAAPIVATDATPLSQERIEGPPPPPELTPEEKAKQEADKKAKEEAAAAERAEAEAAAEAPAGNTTAPTGNATRPVVAPPPPAPESLPADEPPH